MNLQKLCLPLVFAVIALILVAPDSYAQIDYRIVSITGTPTLSDAVTDTFGVHVDATYCIDGVLSGGFDEFDLPPYAPGGFEMRMVDHRTSSPAGCKDGNGQRTDLQEGGKVDTFKVTFRPDGGGDYPVTFSWPAGLSADWNSLMITDGIGGVLMQADMLASTSVQATNAFLTSFLIIGEAKTLAVEREGNLVPNQFALSQNYPNPFNPSTKIEFSIEKTAFTEIAIYNVVGQKVKTLAGETLVPGFYSTVWNGTDDNGQAVTTGVYFVRMVANADNTQFSDLRKLLLMK